MKSYMKNKIVCRRQVLISNFESCDDESNNDFFLASMCKCCDICEKCLYGIVTSSFYLKVKKEVLPTPLPSPS